VIIVCRLRDECATGVRLFT